MVSTIKENRFVRFLSKLVPSKFLMTIEVKKEQTWIRREMSGLVFDAAQLAIRNGGFDPGSHAIKYGDIQRHDFVSRMRGILVDEPFWDRVPRRKTVVGCLWWKKTIPEMKVLRRRLQDKIEEHDRLEKMRAA